MSSKAFNITLDERLVAQIDKEAKKQFTTRSDYIRQAVVARLQETSKQRSLDEDYEAFKKQYDQTLKNLADR